MTSQSSLPVNSFQVSRRKDVMTESGDGAESVAVLVDGVKCISTECSRRSMEGPTKNQLKCGKYYETSKSTAESIDRLPDELLINIVSRLPVVEAGRMSILARRWRYFWTYNQHLTFDGSRVLRALENSCKKMTTERIQFMKSVNRALKSLSCTSIEELRIVFDLDQRYARVINQWLQFAFSRRVRRLELDLAMSYAGALEVEEQRFIFPNVCQSFQLFSDSGCQSLVSLSLREVEVSGEVLELFLSNCPFLEELRVRDSSHLKSLRVGGCPSLRHLEIVENCMGTTPRSLESCAPNLRSLTLYGMTMSMALNNVSSLTNLSLGEDILTQNLFEISSCLPQLETLALHAPAMTGDEELPRRMHLPRLKKLIFDIWGNGHESLLCYTPLIDGAPLLREVVLKLTLHPAWGERITIHPAAGKGRRRHECLEVLRLEGFCGMRTDVELAQYVVDNSVALKKVVIDLAPPLPLVTRNAPYAGRVGPITVAAQGISLLKATLPVGVQMVVL